MNYNAWAEFKVNNDKQIENAKKKCGMPDSSGRRPFQVGPVDKLERNGFLYGILIISIAGGRYL